MGAVHPTGMHHTRVIRITSHYPIRGLPRTPLPGAGQRGGKHGPICEVYG